MDQIAQFNHRHAAEFERSEDRPDYRTASPGQRMSLDQKRAHDRLRTASWRWQQDKLKHPKANVIAMVLLKAVCTVSADGFDADSKSILANALLDLHKRGFSLTEAKEVMRGLRIRYRTEGEKETLLAGNPETGCPRETTATPPRSRSTVAPGATRPAMTASPLASTRAMSKDNEA